MNRLRRHSSEHAGHEGAFDGQLINMQAVEILVGATNLRLMGLNRRDGLKLTGRLRSNKADVRRAVAARLRICWDA